LKGGKGMPLDENLIAKDVAAVSVPLVSLLGFLSSPLVVAVAQSALASVRGAVRKSSPISFLL
jgi:hypothetical protein